MCLLFVELKNFVPRSPIEIFFWFSRSFVVSLSRWSFVSDYLREVDQQQELLKNDVDLSVRRRALHRVQQALIAAQEIGDEKLQIVQQVQDLIENKSRQLDLDYRNLGTSPSVQCNNLALCILGALSNAALCCSDLFRIRAAGIHFICGRSELVCIPVYSSWFSFDTNLLQ